MMDVIGLVHKLADITDFNLEVELASVGMRYEVHVHAAEGVRHSSGSVSGSCLSLVLAEAIAQCEKAKRPEYHSMSTDELFELMPDGYAVRRLRGSNGRWHVLDGNIDTLTDSHPTARAAVLWILKGGDS